VRSTVEILLVEDNPADAELALESFRSEHMADRVHHVHDGVEALDFLFARGAYVNRALEPPPRLVLLDIKLPKVDGFAVLREMKNNPVTSAVPVVMLTSSNVERDVALCYRLGVNSYVQKPVDFHEFRTTVQLIGRYWLAVNATPRSAVTGKSTA
jgi:two-component system, response regulator